MEEMRDKYYPLKGLRSRDDLLLGRKPVGNFLGKVTASWSSLMSSSVTEEAIHLPYTPDPDMAGVLS